MFDLRAIRDNPDVFDAGWASRGLPAQTPAILALDEQVRAAATRRQEAEQIRNRDSKLIGKAKASGDDAEFERLRAEVAKAKETLEAASEEEDNARSELDALLLGLPNIPLTDVPEGEDEAGNVEAGRWGEARQFNYAPQAHDDLGAAMTNGQGLKLIDFEAAAAMSGARFVALRGGLARLERALAAFMLDLQTGEHGYDEVSPPFLVRPEAMLGTGQLPKFGEDSFETTDGHWLIATSEISLTNLLRERILDDAQLPIV